VRKTAFQPTLEESPLERRVVLSHTILPSFSFFKPVIPIDTAIPFVVAPVGISQASVNLTTLRVTQVLFGGSGHGPGLFQTVAIFARTHNTNQLNANLFRQAAQIPYGWQKLLPIWESDITSAISSGAGVFVAQQVAFNDLRNYVAGNEGVTLNYLETVDDFINSLPGVLPNGFVRGSNNVFFL
jgi:hypothetical protein